MTNNCSGPKADGINLAEIRDCPVQGLKGSQPDLTKPDRKRKRAYHRARRSKKPWTVMDAMKAMLESMAREHYE